MDRLKQLERQRHLHQMYRNSNRQSISEKLKKEMHRQNKEEGANALSEARIENAENERIRIRKIEQKRKIEQLLSRLKALKNK